MYLKNTFLNIFVVVVALVLVISQSTAQQLVSTVHAAILTAPVILSTSETTSAGETMNVQGGGFSLTSTVSLQLIKSDGTPDALQKRTLQIADQSPYLIQAVIPADMPAGLWMLTVVNPDGGISNTKYVHQARANGYDNQEVAAGSALRIWGRNMVQPGGTFSTSYATFTSGNTALIAPATAGDPNFIKVTVPAGVVVGTIYTVKVSNGLGSSIGESVVPYPLAIRTTGADPFSLGVPWGADFSFSANVYNIKTDSRLAKHAVGDGVTDDLPAIQAAVAAATAAGGGVVYFPGSTYLLNNTSVSLRIFPNVVLQGAGQANTILQYNKTAASGQYFATIDDAGKIGFTALTIQDLNIGSTPTGVMATQYSAESTEVFFKDITYNIGPFTTTAVGCYCKKALMSGSTITSKTNTGGPVSFGGSDIELSNNSITFGGGRNVFSGDNIVIENSSIHRDGSLDYPQQHEDGAIELSYSRNMHVLNNNIGIIGQHDDSVTAHGSNEQILTQNSVFNLGLFGTASSASSTQLIDTSKDWSSPDAFYPQRNVNVDFFQHPTVAITSGTGLGQWRYIVANDLHSLTVDRPWEIVPDQTSGYFISRWTADRFQITGNTITNGIFGVVLASGANDSVISSNALVNTGGIALWAWNDMDSPAPNNYNYVVWNNQILNNTLHDTAAAVGNPPQIYVGAAIGGPGGKLIGNTTLDNEVRGNSVIPNSPPAYTANGPTNAPGYYNYAFYGGGSYVGPDPIANIGSIFEGNTATNASLQPYVSLGNSQSVAHYAGEPTAYPCLNLKLADRPANNQAIPGVKLKYFKTGTAQLAARTENWPSQADGKTVLNDPFLIGFQSGQAAIYPMVFRNTGNYDVWIKAPGYLAKKIINVTNVQTQCIAMPAGLFAGDFTVDDQNTVTLGDLTTAIRSFNGGTDQTAGLVFTAFGHQPNIADLVTVIRNFNQNSIGDQQ